MEKNRKFGIFDSYRPFLRILTVFESKNFQSSYRNRNICLAISFISIVMGLLVLIFGDLWYCIGVGLDTELLAWPFAIMISAVQMSITYTAFGIKYLQLEQTINSLKATIDKRNHYSSFKINLRLL